MSEGLSRERLPIDDRADEIVSAIRDHRVVVVCGATGSGKTTQLPQLCLRAGLGVRGMIGHTQPRRIAARSVAARIASERGTRLGEGVGVKVRFDDATSPRTRIKLMTDGIALAEMIADPLLSSYEAMIVDEAHERSLNIDLLLASLRQIMRARDAFRVVVTSATIDPDLFVRFFESAGIGGVPIIEVSGRTYPIRTVYREPADGAASIGEIVDAVREASSILAREGLPRDILVFLPGEREIRGVAAAIDGRCDGREVLPLFSRMSSDEQDRVLRASERGRVILATNIAETSLTLPAIGAVVDTGLARIARYDSQRRIATLPIEPVSRASCDQRAGRCGRVAPGVCVRLYSERAFAERPLLTQPEVLRTNLAGLLLRVRTLPPVLQSDPCAETGLPLTLPTTPSRASLVESAQTLFEIGAAEHPSIDAQSTPIAPLLARLPLDPRIARMLLAAGELGCVEQVLVLAAALSIQDPRERPTGRQADADGAHVVFRHQSSDFLTLLNIYDQFEHSQRGGRDDEHVGAPQEWCRRHFVNHARMREWRELVQQLRSILDDEALPPSEHAGKASQEERLHRALLTGLVTGVACREGDARDATYRTIRGEQARIFPGSVLFKTAPQWILAAEIIQTSQVYARTVARIDPQWVREGAAHLFRSVVSDPHVDPETGDPACWRRVLLGDIVVVPRERAMLAPLDASRAREVFLTQSLRSVEAVDRLLLATSPAVPAHGFLLSVRATLREADDAQHRLRRRVTVLAGDPSSSSLPSFVCDRASLDAALAHQPLLCDELLAVIRTRGEAVNAAHDPRSFPTTERVGEWEASIAYQWAPGKDDDGVTLSLPLLALPALDDDRPLWLVPAMLQMVVHALFKSLPKSSRAELERSQPLESLANDVAQLLEWRSSPLPEALAGVVSQLSLGRVPSQALSASSLPDHLRLRIRVVDEQGQTIAVERDLARLRSRLSAKIDSAQRAARAAASDRAGLTSWEHLELDDSVILLDEQTSVRVTTRPSSVSIEASCSITRRGVRRLCLLACRDDLEHLVLASPQRETIEKQSSAFLPPGALRDALMLQVCDRTFLFQQSVPTTQAAFTSRIDEGRGRLHASMRDVLESLSRVLDARARVAQRLSGGTPRLWATSIADIREHAAYLMPTGFLLLLPWEVLRHYPRYAEVMRARLFGLREDGAGSEKDALALILPRWKLLTAWIARAMTVHASDSPARASGQSAAAPLPKARRGAPTVNIDAGAWAIAPEHLIRASDDATQARWLLEELRAAVFADPGGPGRLEQRHAALLARVDAALASLAR